MTDWQPIETAPKDGTIVVAGKMADSQLFPVWPVRTRFLNGKWTMMTGLDAWHSFDPQPTHWKPTSQPQP